MKTRKRILAILTLALMLFSSITLSNLQSVQANSGFTIILDGKVVTFDVTPQVDNGRLLVPFRGLGQAMGASFQWDDAKKQVLMTKGDRFAQVTINSKIMLYGVLNADGSFASTQIENLDAAPIISNSYTLVPLRAISTALGATIGYDEKTKTVTVVSGTASLTTAAPVPTPKATADSVFGDTAYFQEVSGKRAQDMYNNGAIKQSFALAYYSSGDSSSKDLIPNIKEAAQSAGFKVYGVDMNSRNFTSNANLTWINNYKPAPAYPTLYLGYESNDGYVVVKQDLSNVTDITNALKALKNGDRGAAASPSPSPTATSTATATATATATTGTGRLCSISADEAQRMFDFGDTFIFIYYKSNDIDNDRFMDTINSALTEVNYAVYAADAKDQDTNDWFFKDSISSIYDYPMIFYVSNGQVTKTDSRPSNAHRLALDFDTFMKLIQ